MHWKVYDINVFSPQLKVAYSCSCLLAATPHIIWPATTGRTLRTCSPARRPPSSPRHGESKFYKRARSRRRECQRGEHLWRQRQTAGSACGHRPMGAARLRAQQQRSEWAQRAHPPASSRRFVRRPQHILSPFLSPPAMIFSTWLCSQPAYLAP